MPRLTITLPHAGTSTDRTVHLPSVVQDPEAPDLDDAMKTLVQHMDRLALERLLLRIDRLFASQPVSAIRLSYHWSIAEEDTPQEEVFPAGGVGLRWANGRPTHAETVEEQVKDWLEDAMGLDPGALGGGRVQPLLALRTQGWITAHEWPEVSRRVHTDTFGHDATGAWAAAVENACLRAEIAHETPPRESVGLRGRL